MNRRGFVLSHSRRQAHAHASCQSKAGGDARTTLSLVLSGGLDGRCIDLGDEDACVQLRLSGLRVPQPLGIDVAELPLVERGLGLPLAEIEYHRRRIVGSGRPPDVSLEGEASPLPCERA